MPNVYCGAKPNLPKGKDRFGKPSECKSQIRRFGNKLYDVELALEIKEAEKINKQTKEKAKQKKALQKEKSAEINKRYKNENIERDEKRKVLADEDYEEYINRAIPKTKTTINKYIIQIDLLKKKSINKAQLKELNKVRSKLSEAYKKVGVKKSKKKVTKKKVSKKPIKASEIEFLIDDIKYTEDEINKLENIIKEEKVINDSDSKRIIKESKEYIKKLNKQIEEYEDELVEEFRKLPKKKVLEVVDKVIAPKVEAPKVEDSKDILEKLQDEYEYLGREAREISDNLATFINYYDMNHRKNPRKSIFKDDTPSDYEFKELLESKKHLDELKEFEDLENQRDKFDDEADKIYEEIRKIKKGGNFFSNIYNKVKSFGKEAYDRVSAVVNGRQTNPSIRSFTEAHKNKVLTSLYICRTPIQTAIKVIFNIIAENKLVEKQNKLGYDDIYHLSLKLGFNDGKFYRMEKNESISFKDWKDEQGQTCNRVQLKKTVPFIEFWNNALNYAKQHNIDIYTYNVLHNNCQKFLDIILKANAQKGILIYTPAEEKFIKQDVISLLEDSPTTKALALSLPALKNSFDILAHGRGKKGGLLKPVKPALGSTKAQIENYNKELGLYNQELKAKRSRETGFHPVDDPEEVERRYLAHQAEYIPRKEEELRQKKQAEQRARDAYDEKTGRTGFRKLNQGLTNIADFGVNLPFVPKVVGEVYKSFAPPTSKYYKGGCDDPDYIIC